MRARWLAACRAAALAALGGLGLAACSPASGPAAASTAPTNPPTASQALTAAAAPPAKTVQLNAPGQVVDITAALPAGYVTVVDFWSQSCEPCVTYGNMLDAGVADEPRVVIRKVDVGDGFTPVAQAYNIASLPHFFIYDKQKRLRYDLLGADCAQATAHARQLAAE